MKPYSSSEATVVGGSNAAGDGALLRETLWIALPYGLLAAFSGIGMILLPEYAGYARLVHAHLGLLGFGGVLLSGLVSGLLPRWTGDCIHNVRLARLQIRLAAAGALLTSAGLPVAPQVPLFNWIAMTGAFLLVLAWSALFYNLARTPSQTWRGPLKLARIYFLAGAVFGPVSYTHLRAHET